MRLTPVFKLIAIENGPEWVEIRRLTDKCDSDQNKLNQLVARP